MIVGAAHKAPKYFKEAGYRCPTDPRDGLMQYAFQSKLPTWDIFRSMPPALDDFNTFMGNTMGARGYWVDWFPVLEQLLEGATGEAALLVDVGAGKGHDLIAFHNKYPSRGRLVLQEMEAVVEGLGHIDPAIECMSYDFFGEQPVKGKSYFSLAFFLYASLLTWTYICLHRLPPSSTRRPSVLLPPHPARLARPDMPRHFGTGQEGDEAWVLQAPAARDDHSGAGGPDLPRRAGHDHDGLQRRHGADGEAV